MAATRKIATNALRGTGTLSSSAIARNALAIPNVAGSHRFSTSTPARADDPKSLPRQGLLKSLLHGSESAREDGMTSQSQSHSNTVGRGKYIHEIQRHVVRPDQVEAYKAILAEHYPKLGQEAPVRLIGSWEVVVGELETFYHIWEYDGYEGYDRCSAALAKSEHFAQLNKQLRSTLGSRSSWLTQEFAFWKTSPPRESGITNPVYELRTYHLKPGTLLEWESNWRRGLEARKRFVEPIAAYFSQIGQLHTVQHIWRYESLEQRKKTRDAAWEVETWNDTVTQTVKLIDKMHAQIMKPLPFSPFQ